MSFMLWCLSIAPNFRKSKPWLHQKYCERMNCAIIILETGVEARFGTVGPGVQMLISWKTRTRCIYIHICKNHHQYFRTLVLFSIWKCRSSAVLFSWVGLNFWPNFSEGSLILNDGLTHHAVHCFSALNSES